MPSTSFGVILFCSYSRRQVRHPLPSKIDMPGTKMNVSPYA
jgi:hypothetical protein